MNGKKANIAVNSQEKANIFRQLEISDLKLRIKAKLVVKNNNF